MVTRALCLGSLAIAVASSGCEDFATPAELDRPQILAIASDPASVAPGERARLSILVAGPDGAIEPEVSWSITTSPGVPQLGRVERDGDDAYYVAPGTIDEDPTGTLVQADLTAGEIALTGLKAMVVSELDLENPAVIAIDRDGIAIDGDLVVSPGDELDLAVTLEPEATDDLEIAWYSTSFTIEKYRSQPTTAVVPDEAEDGWLFAIARDRGGVGWRSIRVVVGP